jgi:hypothetical protein
MMKPAIILALSLFACQLFSQELPPKVRAVATWQMSANAGLAMALFDTGGAEDVIRPVADKAFKAAKALNVILPDPPERSGKRAEDSAAIMKFLLQDCAKAIGEKVTKGAEAALAEIGLKSGVLLMVYGPGDEAGKALAKAISERAKVADLPEALTAALLKKIGDGAPFAEVRECILDMQEKVGEHLIGIAKASR